MDPASRPSVGAGTGDILGQRHACTQLWKSLAADRLHHCYLFEGPAGVGKATVALRLAMAANCLELPAAEAPCGRCASCASIAAGRHPDVIELVPDEDQASGTISIDQVRDLLRKLALHRHSARRRFVIVDPADLVRVEATNALLKTLEEPPSATGFVLISARVASLLPTVLSRALRVRFGAVPEAALAGWLADRGLPDPAGLARLSQGSPGRALALAAGRLAALRQAREALVQALSGGPAALFAHAEALSAPPRKDWEERVGLCTEALELALRDALCSALGQGERMLDPEQRELAERWGKRLWPGGFKRLDEALEQARARLLLNVSPRLVLEALLATLASEIG